MEAETQSLTDLVAERREEILAEWADRARKVAAARGLSEPELRNLVPRLLDAMADPSSAIDAVLARAESHIGGRIDLGYDLAELLTEFLLLDQVISCVGAKGRPLAATDRERLSGVVQRLVLHVTELFQAHMARDEQRDKRYLRILQTVADEALRDPEYPLGARLDEVLELVRDAMEAHAAALLIYDAPQGRLVARSVVGWAYEDLGDLTSSLDPDAFAGRIVTSEEPTQSGMSSRDLDVPDGLRSAGIRALLGVRLPPTRSLVGILLVGLTEPRDFTAPERMRLQMLGRWLVLQLDNARLFGELRTVNEALAREQAMRERSVAMLAHDLRGPLSASAIVAQAALREASLPPAPRQVLKGIVERLSLSDRLLRNLLDVYRAQAGDPLPLRLERCDLVEVARNTLSDLRPLYGDRFLLDGEAVLEGCWSADDVGRAIWNLCANAAKYATAGTTITVTVRRRGDVPVVSVHNVGPPMDPEDVEALCEGDIASTPGPGSWGLGLFVVRAVANAHGGRMTLRSDTRGTTFGVELPSAPQGPPATSSPGVRTPR